MRIRVGIMVVRSNEIGAFGASNLSTLAPASIGVSVRVLLGVRQ
jgi:hypothetical protein